MTVAAKGDPGRRPMLSDTFGQPAAMASDLNTAWRLAGTQDDGDRTRAFGVIDMALGLAGGERQPGDRQETALIVISVEQGELLAAVNDVAGPYNTLPMSRPRDPSRS